MKPIVLIQTPEEAIANIHAFNDELNAGKFDDPRRFLSYVQCWYAYVVDGEVLFAPSKFIGYASMDAALYMKESGNSGRLDGRVTEKKLKQWAYVLESGHEKHKEFHALLSGFCADYLTSPNARARIYLFNGADDADSNSENEVIKAIKILIGSLSPEGKKTIRKFV